MNIRIVLLRLLMFSTMASCSESHPPNDKAGPVYSAIARGKIDVDGGLLNITAPSDARFDTINVHVGDNIKAGEILASLNSDQESLAVDMSEAEIIHSKAELRALDNRITHAELLAKRWKTAAIAGAAEQQQADDTQQAIEQLNAEIAISKAALEIALIKRKQMQNLLAQRTMRAPQDATVVKVLAQKGATLNTNQNVAFILLPAAPLIVRAEINESYISQIKKNTAATVSLESNPQIPPIKAKVIRIGIALDTSQWSDEQQQPSRVIECILEIEQQQNLLVGQNVMVRFDEQHL